MFDSDDSSLRLEQEWDPFVPAPAPGIWDVLPEPMVLLDASGWILAMNASCQHLMAKDGIHALKDDARRNYLSALPELLGGEPAQLRELWEGIMPVLAGEQSNRSLEFQGEREQAAVWYLVTATAFPFFGRQLTVVVHADITGQKRAEERRLQMEAALRDGEERFRSLVQNVHVGVIIQGASAEILTCNDAALEMLGLTESQLLGKTSLDADWNIIHEDGTPFPGPTHPVPMAIASRSPVRSVVMGVFRPVHGDRAWLLVSAEPQLNADGGIDFVVCSFIDISDRKRAEEALQESEQRYRTVVSVMAEGVVVQQRDGSIVTGNESAQLILGLSFDQLVGRTSTDPRWRTVREDGSPFPGPEHPAMIALETCKPQREVLMGVHRPEGDLRWISINSNPLVKAESDGAYGVVTSFSDVTARKQVEQALRNSEERLRTIVDTAVDGILVIDDDGLIESFNPAAECMFGVQAEDIIGSSIRQILASPQLEHGDVVLLNYFAAGGEGGAISGRRLSGRRQDGSIFPIELAVCRMHLEGRVRYAGFVRDISERIMTEARLFQEKERAQVTLASIGDAVITTDARGAIEYLNPVAEALTGWKSLQARGHPLEDVFKILDEITRAAAPDMVQRCLQQGATFNRQVAGILVRNDGREYSIHDSAAAIRDREGQVIGAVLVIHDVTEQRRIAAQLTYQATHDALTGLINRFEFERRLKLLLTHARESGEEHTLLYLDLDQFKVVNDTCGHAAGDELLRQLAHLLRERLRRGDILARLGGDEFGVMLEHCTLEHGTRIANDILEILHEFHFLWEGRRFNVGGSIGAVSIDGTCGGLSAVLSAADAACYMAKDSGRNRVRSYHSGDSEMVMRQSEMHWVSRINHAVAEDRLCLFAQPIVPLRSSATALQTHYEILIRLRDEQGTLIAPGVFLPAAERYNLMSKIDRWVVQQVIAWCRKRIAEGKEVPVCGINLSGTSLSDKSLLEFIRTELEASRVPPDTIYFEITETAAICNLSHAIQFIRELKLIGCRFALDDFGSGMSSFSYLKNLSVDFLKIDGSFVKDLATDPVDRAMVEAINRVGHAMGLYTIAEYAENQAIIDCLIEIGVDYAQGYGLSCPMPLESI